MSGFPCARSTTSLKRGGESSNRCSTTFSSPCLDVGDDWQRWIAFQQVYDRVDIHDAIGRGIEDQRRDRLVPDDAIQLVPGPCSQEILINEDVPDMRQQPVGQKDEETHGGAWKGIPENLWLTLSVCEEELKKKRTFDTKPAYRVAKPAYC